MKVTFQINYRTVWGEEVKVILPDGQLFPLRTNNGEFWRGTTELAEGWSVLTYQYAIFRDEYCVRKEWTGIGRRLEINPNYSHYILNDAWRDRPEDSYFYSSAFGPALDHYPSGTEGNYGSALLLKVRCPRLRLKDWVMAISGNQPCLGNWDMRQPVVMRPCGPNEWYVLLDASELTYPFEYKFLAWDTKNQREGEWIIGNNRQIYGLPLRQGEMLVMADDEVRFNLPAWKAAGVAIPVFSLRSEASYGVGDFGDLKRMIDWAEVTHQKIVQILPINDTTITHTWTDSYPYSSISIYAFHPMYVDLSQLPPLADKARLQDFERRRVELNALPQVDYEAVNSLKLEYLKEAFEQDNGATAQSEGYQKFVRENESWLFPYTIFCYLRDLYGTPNFNQWPKYQKYDAAEIHELANTNEACDKTSRFYCYVQYLLHVQLLEASAYARSKGILLKGDIPIGVSPNSVEAWTEPHYFNLNGQAGAPPDPFSEAGQNWGLPTYNWEVMEKDGYRWWKRRFRKMAEYFDAYRIDHILGFFRIWEIPSHSVQGLLGQFVPSLPMSVQEIESYGITALLTRPYIRKELLVRLFGDMTHEVEETFLCRLPADQYAIRPEFDTQRKVEAYFQGKNDERSVRLREGLYKLINNVLFIPDRKEPNMYHPRIAVQNDYVYECLTSHEKECFNRLYNHYYYERHNDFWYHEAMKKLPELCDSTRMLVCGEDLGMIPACVKGVMDELRILSLEIQRMPKDPALQFGDPIHYPYRSVCTISTHDMSTLRGWWHEDPQQTRDYYYYMLGGWGDYPSEAPGWLCEAIVMRHLFGNSMLCILSLQDWMSMDEELRYPDPDAERINVPANPKHYWRYRMHVTLEDLIKNQSFNEKVIAMIRDSGR